MENEVKTYTDYEWNNRINSLMSHLLYEQPIPEGTNRYELEAAKILHNKMFPGGHTYPLPNAKIY
jgi:hypothetical protein